MADPPGSQLSPGVGSKSSSVVSSRNEKTSDARIAEPEGKSVAEKNIAAAIAEYNRDRRIFLVGLHALNALTLGILSAICYILVMYLDGFSLHPERAELSDYNVHLVCTVIGFVITPVYAILIFRIFRNVKYSTLTTVHVIILMPTSFLSVYGVRISYESHHVYGRVHLYSLHGWLGVGLAAILFFCIISGNWIYLSSEALPFILLCHKIVGMAMIVIAGSCSISGLLTRSQHLIRRLTRSDGGEQQALPSRVIVLNSLGLMIVTFIILCRWLLMDERFRRRPHPGTANDQETPATGLLRYLATSDDPVLLPDQHELSRTEFGQSNKDDLPNEPKP